MKNLRKSLSLVLALVMILGVFTISASAKTDFPDDADIESSYAEAIEVLVGIGAIGGYEDGTFKPKDTVSRAEAAKMITVATIGSSAASRLTVSAAPFNDVPADNWAAPFIAYCKAQGIIDGVGDGNFDPNGKVTAVQLAKMMLSAAGRNKMGEYTGANWDINVTSDANRFGNIFSGSKSTNLSAPATREETSLYIFRAVTGTQTVKYNKSADYYDLETRTQGTGADAVIVPNYISNNIGLSSVGTTDANGRGGHEWRLYGTTISSFYANTATYSVTTGLTVKALNDILTKYKAADNCTLKINGTTMDLDDIRNAVATSYVVGPGASVDCYTTNGILTSIVIDVNYLGMVTRVTQDTASTLTDERALTISITDGRNARTITATPADTEGFDRIFSQVAQYSYVIVTPDQYGIPADTVAVANKIDIPETVRGKITAQSISSATTTNNFSGYFRIDGTQYNISDAAYTVINTLYSAADFAGTYDFYLDYYGNVLGAKLYAAGVESYEYIYVTESYGRKAGGSFGQSYAASAKVKGITPEGKAIEYDLYTTYDASYNVIYFNGVGEWPQLPEMADSIITPGLYAYVIDADGKMSLSSAKGSVLPTDSFSTSANNANVGPKADNSLSYANSSTELVVINTRTYATQTFKGISNFPTIAAGSASYVYGILTAGTNNWKTIYVYTETSLTVAVKNYAFYVGLGEYTTSGQYYLFYIDGKMESKLLAATVDATYGDVFTYTVASSGKLVLTKVEDALVGSIGDPKVVTISDASYVICGNDPIIYFSQNLKIYDMRASGVEVTSLAVNDQIVYATVDVATVGGLVELVDIIYIVGTHYPE